MYSLKYTPNYYSINFKRLIDLLSLPRFRGVFVIVALWAAGAFTMFQSSYIQYFSDSFSYKGVSDQPLTLALMAVGDRAPTLPLLLKLFKSDVVFIDMQFCFFYLSWLTLFLVLGKMIKNYFIYLVLLSIIATLSLVQVFFCWHSILLSESLSLSGATLLLALLCRFMIMKTVSGWAFAITLGSWVAWQFLRDANAYFSLVIALGLMVLCTFGRRTAPLSRKWKKGRILGGIMLCFTLFQIVAADHSNRWEYPLINVIGMRILPDEERTQEFVNAGMPMNDKVACFKNKQGMECNMDWSGFGDWLTSGKALADYHAWLAKHFFSAVAELFSHWEEVWTPAGIPYTHAPEPLFIYYVSNIVAPKGMGFIVFTIAAFCSALLALGAVARARFLHPLAVVLLFYAANLPLAFISYHGDALDVVRHTLNLQLNTYLTGWILIAWAVSVPANRVLSVFRGETVDTL